MNQKLILLGVVFLFRATLGVPEEVVATKSFLSNLSSIVIGREETWLPASAQRGVSSGQNSPDYESESTSEISSFLELKSSSGRLYKWLPGSETTLNIFLLYVVYRLKRKHRQRQVRWLKRRISADLHDEFGSRLTNIQFLTALSQKERQTDTELKYYLEGIGKEALATTEALDEIVWNMKMKDENLEELIAKMRSHAEESLVSFKFNFEIDVQLDFQGKKMRMAKRRGLYLVYKEMLNNIRKHSKATAVRIHISEKDSSLCLIIEDNGTGFDPFERTERNGIRNAIERIHRGNGQFYIDSRFNEGSRIEILLAFDNSRIGSILFLRKPKIKMKPHFWKLLNIFKNYNKKTSINGTTNNF